MHVRKFLPLLVLFSNLRAEPLVVDLKKPDAPTVDGFHMGTAATPGGEVLSLNSQSLLRNGKPWMPVMGEFHYSRYPAAEWRDELLKMKAGGIDIVSFYVIWNHHEEEEGKFLWAGDKDLRKFIETAKDVGLTVAVRCGPWVHGEVRNGGIPDWLIAKKWKLRSDDKNYLAAVHTFYAQIATQLKGLLWKEGGPVAILQIENEYGGRAEHLLSLKKIAREVGIDVPLYTRTGWPALATPMPYGEIAPLFGAYAEGFWDRNLSSMTGNYWAGFRFMNVRTDTAVANEQLGERAMKDEADAYRYPYLTCELGGGMMSSYHRRIFMLPEDITAVALTKVGSGGNMPGYYMYHGGVNPEGKLSTLMENQETAMTNYNDMPEKNYDFQAPLGAYGQVRPHYHMLRRMHLLARDFGDMLATMPVTLPAVQPKGKSNLDTLRWAIRTNGESGFLFVNNHQRSAKMPEHKDVQFSLQGEHPLTIPATPITIPADAQFIIPFRLPLADGVLLESATAQLVCKIEDEKSSTYFFAEMPQVPAIFTFADGVAHPLKPGHDVAFSVKGKTQEVRIVLLDDADSLALWKGSIAGKERAVLTKANAIFDKGSLRLSTENLGDLKASIYPALHADDAKDGIFSVVKKSAVAVNGSPSSKQIREAGAPREIKMGKMKVAAAPKNEDFAAAAAWEISLSNKFKDAILRIQYQGDVARVKIGDTLIMDDFYNGRPLDIGLKRHAALLAKNPTITLEVLPLRSDAPIMLRDKPKSGTMLSLDKVDVIPMYHASISQEKD